MNIAIEFRIGDRADLLQNTNRQLRRTAFQLVNRRVVDPIPGYVYGSDRIPVHAEIPPTERR